MEYFTLKLCRLQRKLPVVSISPKLKIASFNLLGDAELVEAIANELTTRLKQYDFDVLVGPEVTVVPLIHEISHRLGQKHYVILRKQIHGYMVTPIKSSNKNGLVINGRDAELIRGKKVAIIDDVVSTGKTMGEVENLMIKLDAKVVCKATVLTQGNGQTQADLISLGHLPLFTTKTHPLTTFKN